MTALFGFGLFGVVSLAVAAGLALFQYVVLPIGNGLAKIKELIDDRGTTKR